MLDQIFYIFEILFLLAGILASCQIFTNAIENFGDKLNLSHEFTGSILAAVGTALPETLLPLVAIYMASQGQAVGVAAKNDIAIGAIIGAPFMLSTLAILLLGLSIFCNKKRRQEILSSKMSTLDPSVLNINKKHLIRDLIFFLIIFNTALLASLEFFQSISKYFAILLVAIYIIYLVLTYKASQDAEIGEDHDIPLLYLKHFFKIPDTFTFVIIQCLIGLVGIIYFAHHFIDAIEHVSTLVSISPLILSLIISPIATELPEKVNSWIWTSETKDTLAIGNLSGAMVFQAALPCAIGILFTPWHIDDLALICTTITLISTLLLVIRLLTAKQITYKTLLLIGSLYLVYLYIVFKNFV